MDFLVTENQMIDEIQEIEETFLNKNNAYFEIIKYCRNILEKYRKEIYLIDFPDTLAEILFFKVQKQLPLSNLVYYSNLYSFLNNLPKGGKKFQENFIELEINRINNFFQHESEFSRYMELNHNHFDEFYFTRKYNFSLSCKTHHYYRDPNFSTSHDLVLSELNANGLYLRFLKKELESINDSNRDNINIAKKLEWTESKAALIELIYALHEQKAFNGGRVDLKDIASFFQNVYDFDNADMYRTFTELKSRKKSQTQFLDELSFNLSSRMREI